MNFKDAYKSYNDEIRSNPDVLKTILKTETATPKYTFNFRTLPAYAAALALVVSVSVFSYNHFHRSQEPTVRYIAANENPEPKTSGDLSVADNKETVAMVAAEEKNTSPVADVADAPVSSGKSVSGIQNNSVQRFEPDTEKVYGEPYDNVYHEDVQSFDSDNEINKGVSVNEPEFYASEEIAASAKDAFSDTTDKNTDNASDENIHAPAVANEETAKLPVLYSGDDEPNERVRIVPETVADEASLADNSGVAVMAVANDEDAPLSIGADDACYMSYGEYKEYIGLDIQAKAKIPHDMIFEPMPSATVEYENDTIVSDTFTASAFSVENPQRSLSVSVSKNGTHGTDDESASSVSAKIGDVSVRVNAENVTEEEIDTLINSLK